MDRAMAVTGKQSYAPSIFEHQKSVLNAGVLFSLPALISQGLPRFFKVYSPLSAGFYGLHHMIIMSCFMALCRIRNPEQLKIFSPGELGKLLGLDRIPEVGHFRKKIKQIIEQSKTEILHRVLFAKWLSALPEMFFYIDGHVRVYHGKKANLSKKYVSREKLCLNGTTEFWVNDQSGMPLMVITAELNEKLKQGIEQAIEKIKEELPKLSKEDSRPLFTLVFDRESYEPKWFQILWDSHKVGVITYRKNVDSKWDENDFKDHKVSLLNNDVIMQLCEKKVVLNGCEFREIRKLSKDGHQTSIITNHPLLTIEQTAEKMFSRWTQENFFKYMIANFDFDRMIEYGSEPCDYKKDIPNPPYRKLTYELTKAREKKARLEAKVYKKLSSDEEKTIEHMKAEIAKNSDLLERIDIYEEQIQILIKKRSRIASRITLEQMPEDTKFNKLKKESKMFKNAILMVSYRAETTMYNLLGEFYKGAQKEGRMLLKNIFSSDADLIPNHNNNTLTVVLHSLANPRDNEAAKKLCTILNESETKFPYTNLKLIYMTMVD